jgi:hypothetical protein
VTSTLAQLDKLGLLAISVTSDSVPTESPPVDLP